MSARRKVQAELAAVKADVAGVKSDLAELRRGQVDQGLKIVEVTTSLKTWITAVGLALAALSTLLAFVPK